MLSSKRDAAASTAATSALNAWTTEGGSVFVFLAMNEL